MSAIQEIHHQKLAKSWVEQNLISSDEDSPIFEIYEDFKTRKSKLGLETVLFSQGLSASFVLAMLDGDVPPAQFKYAELMKSIHDASSGEACHWVYITEPDNCLAIIQSIEPHHWGKSYSQEYHLEAFQENPAEEGGCSHMCLLPASRAWVLAHELNPGNDFTISVHSNKKFRDDVLASIGVSAVDDARDR